MSRKFLSVFFVEKLQKLLSAHFLIPHLQRSSISLTQPTSPHTSSAASSSLPFSFYLL
jgi:hypothetical protein